jgi:hypothetical protein
MNLQRYQHDVAAEIPGHPPQLSSLTAVAYNFRHGYSQSSTPPGLQISYTYSESLDDTSSVQGGQIAGAGVTLQTSP